MSFVSFRKKKWFAFFNHLIVLSRLLNPAYFLFSPRCRSLLCTIPPSCICIQIHILPAALRRVQCILIILTATSCFLEWLEALWLLNNLRVLDSCVPCTLQTIPCQSSAKIILFDIALCHVFHNWMDLGWCILPLGCTYNVDWLPSSLIFFSSFLYLLDDKFTWHKVTKIKGKVVYDK